MSQARRIGRSRSPQSTLGSIIAEFAHSIPGVGQKKSRKSSQRYDLVGLDVAKGHSRLRGRSFAPVWIAALVGALLLVALRIDVIRMRYAMAEALAVEQELFDSQRQLTVAMRQLRDPVRIAEQARQLGFARPEYIIDLPSANAVGAASDAAAQADPGALRGSVASQP